MGYARWLCMIGYVRLVTCDWLRVIGYVCEYLYVRSHTLSDCKFKDFVHWIYNNSRTRNQQTIYRQNDGTIAGEYAGRRFTAGCAAQPRGCYARCVPCDRENRLWNFGSILA